MATSVLEQRARDLAFNGTSRASDEFLRRIRDPQLQQDMCIEAEAHYALKAEENMAGALDDFARNEAPSNAALKAVVQRGIFAQQKPNQDVPTLVDLSTPTLLN